MNEGDGGVFHFKIWFLILILFPIFVSLYIYFAYIGLIDPLSVALFIIVVSFMFLLTHIIPLYETIKGRKAENEG